MDDKFFSHLVIWKIEPHSHVCVGKEKLCHLGYKALNFPRQTDTQRRNFQNFAF